MHQRAAVASAATHQVFTYLTQFVHFITLDVVGGPDRCMCESM